MPQSPRFTHVQAADVPPVVAARRMGLAAPQFTEALPALLARGFPAPDPTTGNYDIEAIDAWRRARHDRAAVAHANPALLLDRINRL